MVIINLNLLNVYYYIYYNVNVICLSDSTFIQNTKKNKKKINTCTASNFFFIYIK